MTQKPYDLIVFGATSFVGKIVCRYLTELYPPGHPDISWAAAGRSEKKLNDLKVSLGSAAGDLALIAADASDESSLRDMCQQTRVVISTVGPYALYGEPLVKVCAELGTDYCDLTGEPQWIKQMLDKYQSAAQASGARIVNCCGFDSIPSDMGVFYLQQQSQALLGEPLEQIKMRLKGASGGFSGGTVASLLNALKETSQDPNLRKTMANPYALCPQDHGFSTRQFNQKSAVYDEDFERWSAPFVMAAINTRIVHRSNALLDNAYGDNFRYDEAVLTGRGNKGKLTAWGQTGGLAALMVGGSISVSRALLERFVLPKPGEGPSQEKQEKGFFDVRFFGRTPSGQTLRAKFVGDRDPGYGSTAKMLSQAAICLAKDVSHEQTPGGFWTPSSALGNQLLPRLTEHAGITCELID